MKTYRVQVEFILAEDQMERVRRIAETMGIESVEDCFRFLMTVGSRHVIDKRLDQIERLEPMRSVLKEVEM